MSKQFLLAIAVNFIYVVNAFAGFVGPEEVININWGNGNGQVGYSSEDSGDIFPWRFAVDRNSRIAIIDEVNSRIAIFNSNGDFYKNIYDIGTSLDFDSEGNLYINNGLMKYDIAGNVLFDKSGRCEDLQVNFADQIICYDKKIKKDVVYDSGGNMLSENNAIKVSHIHPESKGPTNTTINVFGKSITVNTKDDFVSYSVDLSGRIYGLFPESVEKFSECGQSLGQVSRPDNLIFKGEENPNYEPYVFYHTEYGDMKVAPKGDIYTWKRTPDTYSILKWTWVDSPDDPKPGPDAPANLKLTPSLDGLFLTWEASPQDPGCVDGYELERATSADGIYTTVTTTDPGVLKFNDTGALSGMTYFYKVRAKGGGEYSPYTVEVSGTRQ